MRGKPLDFYNKLLILIDKFLFLIVLLNSVMSNIFLGKKIKSNYELSYQQDSQTINQINVSYGNGGLNDQQQVFQTTPLASFNTEIDQNPDTYNIRDLVSSSLKRSGIGNYLPDYIKNTINFILNNENLLDTESIDYLVKGFKHPQT